jgi:AraC-like DNA-binding protein
MPHERLRPFVRYYWILKSHGPLLHTNDYLAPDGFEEIIFSFAGHYRRAEVLENGAQTATLGASYLVGCKSVGVNCLRLANIAMVGVKLWPNTLHSLLGVRLDELDNRPLLLKDLSQPLLHELESRLYEARSEAEIKLLLDQSLSPDALSRRASGLVGFSVRRIFAARGDIGIDALLHKTGTHYRTAEKAFRERVGVSPKQLARVIRFKHAFTALGRAAAEPRKRLSAMDFGYYDASHFNKDFRRFTGESPVAFFRHRDALSTEIFRFCADVDLHRLDRNAAHTWSL